MKKTKITWLIAVVLCLATLHATVGIYALEGEKILCVWADGTTEEVSITEGKATLPVAQLDESGKEKVVYGEVLVGWKRVEADGSEKLYPKGALMDAVDGDRYEAVYIKMETLDTVTLRIVDGDVGMRFATELDRASYESLVALVGEGNVSVGTYIVAGDYLQRKSIYEPIPVLTLEYLASVGKTQYIDIPAPLFAKETESTLTYTGAVVNLLRGNYTRQYAGIGYLKVTYANGETATVYGQYGVTKHRHSMFDTVFAAFNDRAATKDAAHGNLIRTGGSYYYSPYTQTEIDTLQAFLDRCAAFSHGEGYRKWEGKRSAYYSPVFTATFEEDVLTGAGIVIISPTAGKTADDIWGLQIGGSFYDINDTSRATFENGKLLFWFDTNSLPY